MKVELYRLSAEPITVEVEADATVKQVLSAPGTGCILGDEDSTLLEAAERRYGGLDQLGTLRVNGAAATLETRVTEGATILIIPKVEGGR
ncbi:MAG: MoaD/ThiS family protein [Planctomycetes bacterium]|nr:MoaD/ThiS family protein [Planctomycetota bacterium]